MSRERGDIVKGQYAVLNLRTTKSVRDELKRRADEQDRSMNWMHDKLLRQALGLKEAA